MGKRILCLALAASLICAAALGLRLSLEQRRLAAGMIRLHVVANSDTPEDQRVKLQVRDAVLPVIGALTAKAKDAPAAAAALRQGSGEIAAAARAALAAEGCGDPVRVSLERERFPRRDYDTFSLPAGPYTALRVTLGKGEGHNWWCVAFPALCLPATAEGFEDVAAAAGLDDGQITLVTSDDETVRVKFRILEWIEAIFG